jgi:SAM-dependent methyltransferase
MSLPTNVPRPQAFESNAAGDSVETRNIAAAYNAIAANYDSQLEPADWIRLRLWDSMDRLFPAGSRVVDVTAGTGSDALHLREHGVAVVACDISPQMLKLLQKKAPDVKVVVSDFNRLDLTERFDGIISTFAGLNTSADLGPFAERAAHLLQPDGILFIHLLNRWPMFDIARQIVKLRWRDAWRTSTNNPREIRLGPMLIPHYLYSPMSLYRSVFARHFRLSRIEGYGFIRPLYAAWGAQLEGLERRLAATFPFHSLGVFFSLELVRV